MKQKRASVLVVALIILGIVVATALSLSLASIREKKASISSSRSGMAYQNAEAGIESVMNDLLTTANKDATVGSLFGANCHDGTTYAYISGTNYSVDLKADDDVTVTRCNTTAIKDIASIKSIGNDPNGQDQRAIEAAVAAGSCPNGYASNDSFCIEKARHATDDWVAATATCAADGARLCSASEWVLSCNRSAALGLSNMPPAAKAYEWVDTLAGGGNATAIGNGHCTPTYTSTCGEYGWDKCPSDDVLSVPSDQDKVTGATTKTMYYRCCRSSV